MGVAMIGPDGTRTGLADRDATRCDSLLPRCGDVALKFPGYIRCLRVCEKITDTNT